MQRRVRGGPVRLHKVGVKPSDIDRLVEDVNIERMSNNPRRIDASAMKLILESLM